jgi:phosphoribosylamine--glycine ligase
MNGGFMKILIVGGGGREHALVWKLKQSSQVDDIFCVPGNGGIAEEAEILNIDQSDYQVLASFARKNSIGLTIVGPEAPLVGGLTDVFKEQGLKVFGPSSPAARLEGSKSFAKQLMNKYGIPTAEARGFTDYNEAAKYLDELEKPYVIKADGLAAGKGVIIAGTVEQAQEAIKTCLIEKQFGSAGTRILIEECMVGPELSILAFCDGKRVLPMVPAQDYKRVYENDEGPNTGGMGSYSPVPIVTPDLYDQIVAKVLEPTVNGLISEGIEFRGIIYAGLMMTENGPKVLEYNVRFGDPETQAILPRLESDLLEPMLAVANGDLSGVELKWSKDVCTTVVLASGGYPGDYATGIPITGLDEANAIPGVKVFHAGTKLVDGKIVTAGGRVLNVSALGTDFTDARAKAYSAIDKIHFDGMHFRKDIALRAVGK